MSKLDKHRNYIREEVDKDAKRFTAAGKPPTCSKGCSYCCHVKIYCIPEEIDEMLSLNPSIDMDKLALQVSDWENSDKSCIFLQEGACDVHEKKPFCCTNHLVDSPAKNCASDSGVAPHYIRTKTANERIKQLFSKYGRITMHEEIYERLK